MKTRKNKRAIACHPTPETRQLVFARDNGKCVMGCGRDGCDFAHYISRAHGGLGIEQNIVLLCRHCHNEFDQSTKRNEHGSFVKKYLDALYPDFTDDDRVYKKGGAL